MANYTQETQDKILDFINRAQNKIADLSTDLARSLDEVDMDPELVQIPIGLLDFIESLLSPHLDWEEADVIDLVDFWMDRAELSKIVSLQLSNYQMPRVTFNYGDGITQAQLDAVNAASVGRDNALQAEVDQNTADILGIGAILPADFYDIFVGSTVNVWADDARLHTHGNMAQIDVITAQDITNLSSLLNHYNNNVAGQKHISEAERITWTARLQGITAPGASLTVNVTDPLNPILSYTQQAIAISMVTLLQSTLDSLQSQINAIPAGATGATPVITIGTVTSGPDETPAVAISGTPEDPVMDFTLKDGVDGTDGSDFVIDTRGTSIDRLNASFSRKTIADIDFNTGTNEITVPTHGYYDGMRMYLSGVDLPDPFLEYNKYYVTVVNASTITLSTVENGTPVDIIDQGSGTIYLFPISDFTYLGNDNGFLYFRLDAVLFPDATDSASWSSGIQIIGEHGWSPLFGLFTSGVDTKVIQLLDWTGGTGTKPSPDPSLGTPYYLGASGWVTDYNSAVNIVGPAGPTGADGAMFFPDEQGGTADRVTYDAEPTDFVFYDNELGLVYKKLTDASADWSVGFQWQGPEGPAAPGGGSDEYIGDSPSTVTVGGLLAGAVLTSRTYTSILQEMLVVFLVPTFTGAPGVTGQSSTVEVGTVLSTTRDFTWATTNPSNVEPNSLIIRDVTGASDLATGLADDSAEAGVTIATLELATEGSTQQWRMEAEDTNLLAFNSANRVITARFYRFFGPNATTPTNSATVRALPSSAFQTANGNTFILATGNTLTKFVVALPPGRTISLVTDLDALGADITSQYVSQGTVSVNDDGGTGTAQTYNLYEMNVGGAYSSSHDHEITTA